MADRRYCSVEEADEHRVKLKITLAYSENELTLLISKQDDVFTARIERFLPSRLRNYKCSLIFHDQPLIEGVGGAESWGVGLEVALMPKPFRPLPPKPPRVVVPHVEAKKVVAVITTFNGLEWTKKCVESIRALRSSHDISLVVSDNCSTDGTLDWLKGEGIRCYTLFGRRSVSAGLNLGLKKALEQRPDYLLIMNNDVILPQDYLDALIDHYESKRAEACFLITGYVRNMYYSRPKMVRLVKEGTTEDMEDFMDTGDFSCFLTTPETIERVGFFDENYNPRYVEDNDWLHKIYAAGGRAFQTGQASFYHDWGTTMKVHPKEKERWIPTFRKNLLYYKEKWGDFPRGAERHASSKDLTQGYPCQGGETTPKELKTWLRDQVALIQMGRIGDVIATLPIAKEIHNAGDEVVWLVNQRFLPFLITLNYIDEVIPFEDDINDSETYFGKKFQEAKAWAEKQGFRRIVIAQITPTYTDEFFKSPYVHNKFHYILCLGRMPKSLKPEFPIVPFPIEKQATYTVGIIPYSHSLPIHWGRYDTIDAALQAVSQELDVEYVNIGLEAYKGKTSVREIGSQIAIHHLSGAIDSLDLLLTVDTGAFYPGLITDTPIIHILPKPRVADDPRAPPKYSCDEQGFSKFCEIIDYWYAGSLEDLDKIIVTRLREETDLRDIKNGYVELKRSWATL